MLQLLWSTPLRKWITSTCVAIASVFGVITGASKAIESWDDLGMPTPATRSWTRSKVAHIPQVLLDINSGKREAAEARRDQLELEELKASTPEEKLKAQQLQRKQNELIQLYNKREDEIRKDK